MRTVSRTVFSDNLTSLYYLLAFGVAEALIAYVNSASGLAFYFMILIMLMIPNTVSRNEGSRSMWLALGLVPLMRIVSLVIPIAEISEIYWYLMIAIPVFVGAFIVMRNLKIGLPEVGLNGNMLLAQIVVAALGIGLGLADYLILKPQALNSELTIQATLFPAFILLVFSGFLEELVFRGIIQKEASAIGSLGWVYVALFYSVLQMGLGSPLQFVFALGVSLFYGWIVKATGSIIGVSLSHGLLIVGMFLVFPHIF